MHILPDLIGPVSVTGETLKKPGPSPVRLSRSRPTPLIEPGSKPEINAAYSVEVYCSRIIPCSLCMILHQLKLSDAHQGQSYVQCISASYFSSLNADLCTALLKVD